MVRLQLRTATKQFVLGTRLMMHVAGVGHPLVPKSALSPSPTPPEQSAHYDAPILGVDLYSLRRYTPAVVRFDGQRSLNYIKRMLHAQNVGVMWNFYSTSNTSDAVSQ